MQTGSPRHKRQFLESLKNSYYENIWTEEIKALEIEQASNEKEKKAALEKNREAVVHWQSRIDLIKRYESA